MGTNAGVYDLEERHTEGSFLFFFISVGITDIVKAIQYKHIGRGEFHEFHPMYNREFYNLGFGDYDIEQDKIHDLELSNNGDQYKVFNTVLSTIPGFFESNHGKVIMVNGSDSRPEFVDLCKSTCRKKCTQECKKLHQRIGIYQTYVKKNYDTLTVDYQFFGGVSNNTGVITVVEYDRDQTYESVFLFKK